MSLKAQLRGEQTPEFRIVLPTGWVRHEPTSVVRDDLLKAAKSRLMQVHRPDLYGQMQASMRDAFDGMRRAEVVALFLPGPGTPDDLYVPISLTASIRRGRDGATLDATVTSLIREKGAKPLGEDKRFVTWREDSATDLGEGKVPITSVFYLTPIPGSDRRRALLFSLVTPRPTGGQDTLDYADAAMALFDACVSTLTWEAS